MKPAFVLLVITSLAIGTSGARAEGLPITGERNAIDVIDGDTLQIGPTTVQLAGIDAPEPGQVCTRDEKAVRCGMDAARALQKIIGLAIQPVVCSPIKDMPGATVATCLLGERDVSLMLIDGGYVVALPDAPAAYQASEKQAKAARLGIWGSVFMPPEAWRAENLAPSEAARAAGICLFHGRTDKEGRRLYYGPLDPEHGSSASVTHDGPLFCSDEEARGSGWSYALSKRQARP
jgi:endonuclease YncB( thermonuclease family)